ncbi:MAG: 16S rRNA (uracil(1498)-N(3))-methyltransferase [Bdellovibrionota bacterium]
MRKYWIDEADITPPLVYLRGTSFHHICDVCRQGVGDVIGVMSPSNKLYIVKIQSVGKKEAVAEVLEEKTLPTLPKPYVHLALCIPRFPVFETVLEKSVELGVKSIQPLFSENSFIRTPEKWKETKKDRWDRIIKSALQQSGRGDKLILSEPVKLDQWRDQINLSSQQKCLFAYEGPSHKPIKEELQAWDLKAIEDVWILVGGEGGFSTREVALLQEKQVSAVTLGEQVLRVETACTALVSILKYELNLMRS